MRIIKLSKKDPDMPNIAAVHHYFGITLRERNPLGKFYIVSSKIADGGLAAGEHLVFTYKAKIEYRAQAGTTVQHENGRKYFCVNMDTLVKVDSLPVEYLEKSLAEEGITPNIRKSQGWNRIPDSDAVAAVLAKLFGGHNMTPPAVNKEEHARQVAAAAAQSRRDNEGNLAIESRAIGLAAAYYENKGYTVTSVETEKCGWDLTADKPKSWELQVEVKGHKGDTFQFELTHNEYANMRKYKDTYRVFVVRNALSDAPLTTEFSPQEEDDGWYLQEIGGQDKVRLEEKTAAKSAPVTR